MRIVEVVATPLAVPFRADEVWAFGRRKGLVSILVEVRTDEGVVGLAEASAYPSADIVLAALRQAESLAIGEDPTRIERLVRRLDLIGTWHHVGTSSPALAAVETACWDIVAKVSGQPLVNLFGGVFRDRVEFFYYVARTAPGEVREEGRRAAALGYSTCYLKIGADDPATDVARVAALRDGAGPDLRIRVDANEAWSAGEAIRMIGLLEQYDLELVEQPVSGRNLPEMAYVRSRVGVPMLANEASWTRQAQLAVVRAGAADVISVDNQMDGGLLNLKRSAGLCEAAGLAVVKHSLGELGVGLAAATHVIASTPNFRYANQAYGALLADDITDGFGGDAYVDGALGVPTAPGLGIELDRDKVERYARLYAREGDAFSFGGDAALVRSVGLPKR